MKNGGLALSAREQQRSADDGLDLAELAMRAKAVETAPFYPALSVARARPLTYLWRTLAIRVW